jgi:Peptide methionine sulfoxide reductase
MANIDGLKHYVLRNPLKTVPEGYKEAIFGNGCFWGTEKSFWRLPQGTLSSFFCDTIQLLLW